jgi:hypothetical protein
MGKKGRKTNSIDLAVASAQVPLYFACHRKFGRKEEAAQTTYERNTRISSHEKRHQNSCLKTP